MSNQLADWLTVPLPRPEFSHTGIHLWLNYSHTPTPTHHLLKLFSTMCRLETTPRLHSQRLGCLATTPTGQTRADRQFFSFFRLMTKII